MSYDTILGPMIHLSLGGDEVLVLNDAKDANELVSLMDGRRITNRHS